MIRDHREILKKFRSFIIIINLILIGFFGITLQLDNLDDRVVVTAKVVYVGGVGPGNFSTIQGAIDAAVPGDTVYVFAGIYVENVVVNKTISLIGSGATNTIIVGSSTGSVVLIESNYVNISGFNVTNSGSGLFDAGIGTFETNYTTIRDCIVMDNYIGIRLYGFLVYSKKNIVENNTVFLNDYGIFIRRSTENLIRNNTCNYNTYAGISNTEQKSIKNVIENNTNKNNGVGILISAHENIIQNNNCSNNGVGIRLGQSDNNLVYNNNIYFNTLHGIFTEWSENNITCNTISNNVKGIEIWGDDSYLYHNNFISNTQQAVDTYSNNWNNSDLEGNYWSDYAGVDDGSGTGKHAVANDGIGDTNLPHLTLDNYPFIKSNGWIIPGVPVLLDPGSVNTTGNYSISWIAGLRTTGHILQEDNSSDFLSPVTVYEGQNTTMSFSGRTNDTYYYRLKSYNAYQETVWSNIVDIIVDWLPECPENLTVSVYPQGNTLNLTWDPNMADTLEYDIEYKNASLVDWVTLAPVLHPECSFDHIDLTDGTEYQYRIRAGDHRGQFSSYSEVITAVPLDTIAPAKPTGLTILSSTNDSIELEWDHNTEEDLAGYNLYRSTIENTTDWGEAKAFISGGDDYYLDIGLDEVSLFYYVLTAVDEVPNESLFSEPVSEKTILGQHGPELNNSIDDFDIVEDTSDDTTINLYNWFKDLNGDKLTFKVTGANNISVAIDQPSGAVMLIPISNWNGEETLTFYASDNSDEFSDEVVVTVTPINDPPGQAVIVSPMNGSTFDSDRGINFSATCSDPDTPYGDKLTFTWSSNISADFGSGTNLTNIILPTGFHEVTLTVSDLSGESAIATIVLTILPKQIIPDDPVDDNTTNGDPDNNNTIDDNKDKSGKDKSSSTLWQMLLIVCVVAIIAVVLFMFMRNRKKQDIAAEPAPSVTPETGQIPALEAQPLETIEQPAPEPLAEAGQPVPTTETNVPVVHDVVPIPIIDTQELQPMTEVQPQAQQYTYPQVPAPVTQPPQELPQATEQVQSEEPVPDAEQVQATVCTTCGQPLTFFEQNNSYYCYNCNEYK